eukprot:TRINITY_DN9401_c0_g1_i1.p1 TRINITY_DN9401_c0_g1~~TRINITY_DN9401_c0_g1_i1.p1  ORF type:complete len:136 (-),score=12.13 TRINITY_DN9401_c0_g1_i1:214-621(-)
MPQEVPILILPPKLEFDVKFIEKSQQLVIYNPFDFALFFELKANDPSKVGVSDHSNQIKPKSTYTVDVNLKSILPLGSSFKLLCQLSIDGPDGKVFSKKVIPGEVVVHKREKAVSEKKKVEPHEEAPALLPISLW